jgi:hypothetical protein
MKRLTARPKASGTKRAHERRALLLPNGAYSSSMNEERPYLQIPVPQPPPDWRERQEREDEDKKDTEDTHIVVIQL